MGETHNDRANVDEIDKNRSNEASSAKVDEIDKNRSNKASSAKVDEVDKRNAEIVESKDDNSDTDAEGVELQDDNVAKSERDEASEAMTDVVAEAKFLRNAIQRQMWNKRQRPHNSGSNSSSAAPQSVLQNTT